MDPQKKIDPLSKDTIMKASILPRAATKERNELRKLNKHELLMLLKSKYKLDFDDRTETETLIDEVIRLRKKDISNLDIAKRG